MPWLWKQKDGEMWSPVGGMLAVGYSGAPSAKNNPAMQNVKDVGPIPRGQYTIGHLILKPSKHGPAYLELTHDPANEMHGRSGFLIHGDSVSDPGTASKGCIILPRWAREAIAKHPDKILEVK